MKKSNLIVLLAAAVFTVSCSKGSGGGGSNTPVTPVTPTIPIIPTTPTNPTTSADGDVVGKVVVGYQGWFSAKGDGSPSNSWNHQNLEMWPDTREYTKTYSGSPFQQNGGVTQPPFTGNMGNGQPAVVFSSYDQSTVSTHFLWMQQNGIDCAAVQRFGSELKSTTLKAQRDGIAERVRIAAEATGRKFYIMYDISGWTSFQTDIKTDWTSYMKALTSSPAYAVQNGKPVVCVWGPGFANRPGDVFSWTDVLSWFKTQGCYVIVGAPSDFATKIAYQGAYNTANMIMPWMVGSNNNLSYYQGLDQTNINYCNARGIDYQANVFPGFAFFNSDPTKPKNEVPRMHGDFMWAQFAAAKNAAVKSIYISMFDELNEGTAIMKVAEDASMAPAGQYFLNLDADGTHVSADFYLRLVNNGQKMIKGTISYTATNPTSFQ
ncbi:glycoside hydrolase family 71/99-like protein [Mucilaginibacter sp.]|uniref:glycoside hydrolase family 71/99-like protein n=1 Tax=Mucilaginibacter sp. TaxID=1882438 RepID=UPI00261FCD07|nr:glycoside hydrolase family 71/99-like protein [Mucilaginibacter sp.]MDB4925269.1 hypothetical protein [Mucilaginibacter sp.]